MESRFVLEGLIYIRVLIHNREAFSHIFLRIVNRTSIHILQLVFINVFVVPIGFGCVNTLNTIYLRRLVCDVVLLK